MNDHPQPSAKSCPPIAPEVDFVELIIASSAKTLPELILKDIADQLGTGLTVTNPVQAQAFLEKEFNKALRSFVFATGAAMELLVKETAQKKSAPPA